MSDNVVPLRPLKTEESLGSMLARLMREFPDAQHGIVIVFEPDRGMRLLTFCDTAHASHAAARLSYLAGRPGSFNDDDDPR